MGKQSFLPKLKMMLIKSY